MRSVTARATIAAEATLRSLNIMIMAEGNLGYGATRSAFLFTHPNHSLILASFKEEI